MGFYYVIVTCLFAARSVDGFVVPGVPPRCPRAPEPALSNDDAMGELRVSRGELLRELLPAAILGAVVVGSAKPAAAALPTAEDYSFGTGSKVGCEE